MPKSVETTQGGKVTILWNQQVQTDRTILNNKPDIIICDNEKGTCMLIDNAISGGRNVIKKETEKTLKYKDLTTEIQHMWNVKIKVLPVIIGVTGTISESFRTYVSNIPGNHEGTTENSHIGHRIHTLESKDKGKAVLLQAWSGPEDSRELRFPDYMTTAQDGGKFVSLSKGRLYPQEMLLILISVRG